MSLKLLKCLLVKEFFDKYKHKLSTELFVADSNAKNLYNTLSRAYQTIQNDLTVDSLKELHFTYNPALSESNKQVLEQLFYNLKSLNITDETSEIVLKQAIEQNLWTKLSNIAIDGGIGLSCDVYSAQNILDNIKEGIVLDRDIKTVTDDIEELLSMSDQNQKWKFNLPTLVPLVEGIGPNIFTLIAARTNAGKTSLTSAFVAQPEGFLDQGAHVTWVATEESAWKTKLRMLSSHTGLAKNDIRGLKLKAAQESFNKIKDNLHVLDVVKYSIEELDAYLKDRIHPTDILIVDILDKLMSKGSGSQDVERLGELYMMFRELLKKYNIAGIGTCQASIDADDELYFGTEALANSKTAKGGELDLCLCLGMKKDPGGEELGKRTLNVAKNKISGIHNHIHFAMDFAVNRATG